MNITPNYQARHFAFQQRIKMNPANAEKLAKTALIASGVGSITAGSAAADTVFGPSAYDNASANYFFNPELVKSAEASLLDHSPEGIPAQSTAIPIAATYSGIKAIKTANKIDNDRQIPS